MPTYEYECHACGQIFEEFQSITAEPLTVCRCGKEGQVRRKIGSGTGIIFRGSGFYQTDYRSSAYKEAAKKEAPAPCSTCGAAEGSCAANGGNGEK